MACFSPPRTDGAWVQLNVGLVRNGGQALPSARAMFRAICPYLDAWRRDRALHWWFFMRKPPDVRLRMFLAPAGENLSGRDLLDRFMGDQLKEVQAPTHAGHHGKRR